MRASAYTFGASPYIITADDIDQLEPERICAKIQALLPVMPIEQQAKLAPAFERITDALRRPGD
jgi:hypothetical protein